MAIQSSIGHRGRLGRAGLGGAFALLVAACGASAPGGPSITTTSTPRPTPSAPALGPVDYVTWVEVQGFGGSSGLREVRKGALYIQEHDGREDLFDLDGAIALTGHLVEWLDTHVPTPCWARYHASVRTSLATLRDAYVAVRPAVEGGASIPLGVVSAIVAAATAAFEAAPQTGCS